MNKKYISKKMKEFQNMFIASTTLESCEYPICERVIKDNFVILNQTPFPRTCYGFNSGGVGFKLMGNLLQIYSKIPKIAMENLSKIENEMLKIKSLNQELN